MISLFIKQKGGDMIRVLVDITGGVVQKVTADVTGIEIMVVDYDSVSHTPKDDPHCVELVNDCGRKDWAGVDTQTADFNPKLVDHYFKQVEKMRVE